MKRALKRAVIVAGLLLLTYRAIPIAHAQNVPEEARRHMVRARVAVEMAKSPDELGPALKEFAEAARLAPNWPDPYYNLSLLQEKTGKLKEAVASLREYLRLVPNAPDAGKVRDHIYELEYKAEQQLTIPDVIDTLVSFSDGRGWKVSGDCSKDTFKFRRGNRAGFMDKLVAIRPASTPWYNSDTVEDPLLKYYFVTHKYPLQDCAVRPVCCDDECMIWEIREVEVVSKTLVRVKQKIMKNVPRGKPESGMVERTLSCTFTKE